MARILNEVNLWYQDSSSDKVYNTWIEDLGNNNYTVGFSYGRRGNTLIIGQKTTSPVDYTTALKIQNKLIAEKQGKGYRPVNAATSAAVSAKKTTTGKLQAGDTSSWIPQLLTAIDATEVDELLDNDDYILQEKVDGERRSVIINDSQVSERVISINRKSKYVVLPQVLVDDFKKLGRVLYHFDGELIGDTYYVFDLIDSPGTSSGSSYHERLKVIQHIFTAQPLPNIKLVKSAEGFAAKHKLYEQLIKANAEGVVFKHKYQGYTAGRNTDGPYKYKFYETASFIVHKVNQQRSVELKLYTGRQTGEHVLVGNVTIPVNFKVPEAGAVIEVRYLYAYLGGSVYQPVYLGERTDISPEDCVLSQLKYKRPEINLI